MITTMSLPVGGVHAWSRTDNRIYRLPALDTVQRPAADVLSPGGRTLIFEEWADVDDPSLDRKDRFQLQGLFRMDLATGAIDRANYPGGHGQSVQFAGSPDGHHLAVAGGWWDEPPGGPKALENLRSTLYVAGFENIPPRPLLTVNGGIYELRWSPDGSMIALRVSFVDGRYRKYHLLILDAATGSELINLANVYLVGTALWSPDSARLLFCDFADDSLSQLNVHTGRTHRVPFLAGPLPSHGRSSEPRLLGYADNQRLMFRQQRGKTITLSTVDIDTGTCEGLLRWTATPYMYPYLATMPDGYWN